MSERDSDRADRTSGLVTDWLTPWSQTETGAPATGQTHRHQSSTMVSNHKKKKEQEKRKKATEKHQGNVGLVTNSQIRLQLQPLGF